MTPIKIFPDAFPTHEREAVSSMADSLCNLSLFLDQYSSALALFDFCQREMSRIRTERMQMNLSQSDPQKRIELMDGLSTERWKFAGWLQIAFRDAALTINHFRKAMLAAQAMQGRSPTAKGLIDHSRLRKAGNLFHESFLKSERVRHAVGHAAELTDTPEKVELNSFRGDYEGSGFVIKNSSAVLSGVVNDNKYLVTHEGDILSIELSDDVLAKLQSIKDEIMAAFAPLENFSMSHLLSRAGKP